MSNDTQIAYLAFGIWAVSALFWWFIWAVIDEGRRRNYEARKSEKESRERYEEFLREIETARKGY